MSPIRQLSALSDSHESYPTVISSMQQLLLLLLFLLLFLLLLLVLYLMLTFPNFTSQLMSTIQ